MANRKTQKRHRRKSSKKMSVPGLKTVKNIGKKSASGIKKGFSTVFGFLKNGLGLAVDTAEQGIKKGKKILTLKRKSRKHSRKH